jgi:hypothetical protein
MTWTREPLSLLGATFLGYGASRSSSFQETGAMTAPLDARGLVDREAGLRVQTRSFR